MTFDNVDAKSWGISVGLHALLLLIMVFWAAFPDTSTLSREIEIAFLMPKEERVQPLIADARPRVEQTTQMQRSRTPQTRSIPSAEQPAARSAAAPETTARESGREEAAPSTPVTPRVTRGGADAIDFMDEGGGKSSRASAPVTDEYTRRESREQGLSTSTHSSDQATGAGAGREHALTRDPGTLSATPHSSTNIEWDGGLSRNRIAGQLPAFPPGADREVQVAVRFQVRPDGTMYGMTVIQRGDPRYERAALDAMRTWRFNALPPDAKQADQMGTAVFSFKLR